MTQDRVTEERLREMLAAYVPAECDINCDDPFCSYIHTPAYGSGGREGYLMARELLELRSEARRGMTDKLDLVALESARRAMMSELLVVCQPDNGSVFAFIDDHQEIADAIITAYLEALSPQEAAPGAVGVKKLEWDDSHANLGFPIFANTILGQYKVWEIDGDGFFKPPSEYAGILAGRGAGIDGAKAAAQADFDECIRSALTVLPSGQNETGGEAVHRELVEKVRDAVLACGHTIDGEQIVLRRSDKISGNALGQLFNRLSAALHTPASGERNAVVEAAEIARHVSIYMIEDDMGWLHMKAFGHEIILCTPDSDTGIAVLKLASLLRLTEETPNA